MEVKNKLKIGRFAQFTLSQQIENDKKSLVWSTRNGMPRITVYLGNDAFNADKSLNYNKIIIARFTPFALGNLISKWEAIIAKGEQDYAEVECLYPKRENGVAIAEKEITAIVRLGIDENGICYIYIEEKDKPKSKFNIVEGGWHKFRSKKSIDYDKESKLSQDYAKKYIEFLKDCLADDFKKNFVVNVEIEENNSKPKGNYNNYKPNNNYNNNNSNNNTTKPAKDSNDLSDLL